MKILIGKSSLGSIHSYSQKHLDQIKKVEPTAEIVLAESAQEFAEELKNAEIAIVETRGWDYDLKTLPNLKWVHAMSAGVTNLAADLKEAPVLLTNSSGVSPIPIAEHVFAMMLMFSRKINLAYRIQVLEKTWQRDANVLKPFELSGLTLGIVGYGRIGEYVAKLAKGFNMHVVALQNRSEIHDANVDKVTKNIDELLHVCDFVVDCLPETAETAETAGYFDGSKFSKMREFSYFINIGRGKTVVEKDLIDALQNKVIAGAGLDVTEIEPLPEASPLWGLENVIITPHYSGWTPKYSDRVIEIFCENLKAYLENKTMPTLVDKDKGY